MEKTRAIVEANKEVQASVSAVPRMTLWLEKRLDSVEKDIAAKKNIAGPFTSAAELDRRLAAL